MEKKDGLTIKVKRSEMKSENIYEKVKNHLRENSDYAYTRIGLMVELLDRKPKELNAPFADWPKGAPNEYNRTKAALEKLIEEGLIESKKQGKKYLYWWKQSKRVFL